MTYHYPEVQFGFVHVANNKCLNLESKNDFALNSLDTMLAAGVQYLGSVHENKRLPTVKKEIDAFREIYEKKDKCQYEFFKRARSADDKGLWSIFGQNAYQN